MNECPSIEVLESMGFDFTTTFGMEFEFYCVDKDREGVASYLNEITGISVRSEHYNHIDNHHYWKITSDASLDSGESEGEYDCGDCDVNYECDHDCVYSCTPSYDCSECEVHTYEGKEGEGPECGECAELNDFPEYNCEDCDQDEHCDEDCSYHCSRTEGNGGGMELVSPILLGYKGIQQAYKMLEALKGLDCNVDETCGMHIHLDGESLSYPATKNLAALYIKYEATIDSILPASRRQNCNCKSMCSERWGSRGRDNSRLERLARRFDEVSSARVLEELAAIWRDRFIKLNFEAMADHGTVEFRQHGGTLNFEKTLHWTILCMKMRYRAVWASPVTLTDDKYPSLESMMDELVFSSESRAFWTKRRDQFATDVDRHRIEDDALDEERRVYLARQEHDERVSAQESLRWNAESNELPPTEPWLIWDYQVRLPHTVEEMIITDLVYSHSMIA